MPTNEHMPEPWRRRLYIPAYTTAIAARYSKSNPRTVSYWHRARSPLGPALPGKQKGTALSYLQLVEVAFVATFRSLGVSLQRLRKAHDYLETVFEAEYPFATLRLETEGSHVLMDLLDVEPDRELEKVVIADEGGQLGWKSLVGERFAEFDYEHDLAVVWHPAGRESEVAIDPRISFGAPQVSGIPTWAIRGRSVAGELIQDIAEDFGLSDDQVKEALVFEKIEVEEAA